MYIDAPNRQKASEPKKDPMGLAEPWNASGESPRGTSLTSLVNYVGSMYLFLHVFNILYTTTFYKYNS
jgi:hypothetical protein